MLVGVIMKTKEFLNALAHNLGQFNYTDESERILELLKNSQDQDIEKWTAVLEEVRTPIPPNFTEGIIGSIVEGAIDLYQSMGKLSQLDKEDLEATIELASSAPGVKTSSGIDFNELKKISVALSSGIKTAQLSDWLSRPGAKAKLIPFVGPVISSILAMNNVIYGLKAYANFVSEAQQIGLSWMDTFYPDKLSNAVSSHSGDPDKMAVAARTTKAARTVQDEAISFLSNSLDAVKDMALLFFAMTGPLWFGADIGSSVLIVIAEMWAEGQVLPMYDSVLVQIAEIAENAIQRLTPQPDANIDYSSMSMEELEMMLNA
jgi:hypothetical protein